MRFIPNHTYQAPLLLLDGNLYHPLRHRLVPLLLRTAIQVCQALHWGRRTARGNVHTTIVEMVMHKIEVLHMAIQMAERSSNRDGEESEEMWAVAIMRVSIAEVDSKVDRLR